MDWKHWYRELEQDDETWDVSEEVVLRGVVHLDFCGHPSEVEVEFIVGADSEEQAQAIEEPTEPQRKTWEKYMACSSAIHPQVLESIYHHYVDIVEKYRKAYSLWGEDPNEYAPYVERPEQLLDRMQLISILISDSSEKDELYLNFNCSWDREHGLGVHLKQLKIEHIQGLYTLYDLE
ncbi:MULTISPECIES: DUF6985 domain-containing protein [Paenibacillus]|jgi:hypothetical protein|uniref:DUF6985 domain-containing protein n=1 Tax=Paenibacillus TaxID=44249 RepID=UPI00031D745B|nr:MULTISPECIES: hypothetical protein [Paenibacillus]MDP9677471.1 hypothetical protein [Paenibacillus jamilae]AJE51976.1 hypothetical protein RE92_13420 [Paenibacillus polymyxa]KAE8562102.1 hypothetical protein BJH92_00695 [Paenibacillus polymyxa]KAF6587173.1 hypothetical protein G9G57_01795 [Paenibacillus sp. EKM211P]KJD40447.1 hypothetical protein QD46_09820 [Paenibacillus polymyxa]